MTIFTYPRRLFEYLCDRQGYGVRFYKKREEKPGYEFCFPKATYAPWSTDGAFREFYAQVRPNTLVDVYRCYELWQLVAESRHVPGVLIEVGVWKGGTAAVIARRARDCGIREPLYACDTFRGVVKAGPKDSSYRGGEHGDASREEVSRLLDGLRLDNVTILEGVFPDDTAHLIGDRDRAVRFCHIDVDVYDSARDIFSWLWPRLSPGGMVVFDDYGFDATDGITRLVNEMRGRDDRLVIHNVNGHGIVVKLR